MRLALGTVQFGLSYGAFNQGGQVSAAEVKRILACAAALGIEVLDTAFEYGEAEKALGLALPAQKPFRIVTKTAVKAADAGAAFRESLARLRRDRVYGLLVHHAQELLGPGGDALWATLESARGASLVEKIGVSVYTGAEIDALLARFPIELVQLPVNVFDQRLVAGGQLARLKERGVEIHARSAFLQGLLLSPLAQLPPHLELARAPLEKYFQALGEAGVTPLEGALGFLRCLREIDEVVVGVLSEAQLREIHAAFHRRGPAVDFGRFALSEERILNPALWKKA